MFRAWPGGPRSCWWWRTCIGRTAARGLLFSALARVGRLRPLLLVGTFRNDEVGRRHPLRPVLAEIERGGRCERIDLQPLDRSATAELVGAIDATAGRHFVDDVHRRSGGNPFFVEELVATRVSADWSVYPTHCEMSCWPGPTRSMTPIWRSSVSPRPLGPQPRGAGRRRRRRLDRCGQRSNGSSTRRCWCPTATRFGSATNSGARSSRTN